MKITKQRLKQIIREEIENVLKEESFQKALSAPGIGAHGDRDPAIENFLSDVGCWFCRWERVVVVCFFY